MACVECGALLIHETVPAFWWSTDGKVYIEEMGLCNPCTE